MNSLALELKHVTVRYEANASPVIDDVSFAVPSGQRVALLGLNGSGKTTLFMAAVGIVEHQGEMRIGGEIVTYQTLRAVRQRVGFLFNVPEDQLLFPKVIDDVAFSLLRNGVSAQEALAQAKGMLTALGIAHLADAPLHHLSHGQKQRVALAGALVSSPQLLLLDEPSSALDPPSKRDLARLLGGLDSAMIVATHDLDFAASLCTRFVVIERGRLVFDGSSAVEATRSW